MGEENKKPDLEAALVLALPTHEYDNVNAALVEAAAAIRARGGAGSGEER